MDSDSSDMDVLSTVDTVSNTDTDPDITAFDLDLPTAHNYLGDLERVSGNSYLEPNRNYEMPIMTHTSLVYPGEILPMILSQHVFLSADFNDDGLIFGLICRELQDSHSSKVFGVTCQIFERSNDNSDDITIKSRAYQRFYVKNQDFTIRNRTRFATVTILPEIELSHPIFGHDSNSLSKFRQSEFLKSKLLKHQSKSLQWPDFVYKMYDVEMACDKIKKFLSTMKIVFPNKVDSVPMDLVSMSFWFCQNAILSTECRRKAFLTNNVLERILLICQTLQEEKYIVCKNCRGKIAKFESLFPMSKEGVRTNFCNPHGTIHDTHTITSALPDAVTVGNDWTSEFCWYPGYVWSYVHCANCHQHLGWKYFSRNLIPKSFYGLSGYGISFDSASNLQAVDQSAMEADSSADEW